MLYLTWYFTTKSSCLQQWDRVWQKKMLDLMMKKISSEKQFKIFWSVSWHLELVISFVEWYWPLSLPQKFNGLLLHFQQNVNSLQHPGLCRPCQAHVTPPPHCHCCSYSGLSSVPRTNSNFCFSRFQLFPVYEMYLPRLFSWLGLCLNSNITFQRHCMLLHYLICFFLSSFHSLVNLLKLTYLFVALSVQ